MKKSSGFLGTAVKILIVIVLLGVLGGTGWLVWSYFTAGSQDVTFKTEKVTKGNLTATISSTGTIEPEEVIDVGAQIAGQVIRFGPDLEAARKVLNLGDLTVGTIAHTSAELEIARIAQITGKLTTEPSLSPSYDKNGIPLRNLQLNSRTARFVDWCTNVEAGDVLAQLDDSLYIARVKQSEATLRSARADLASKKASAEAANREWERDRLLVPGSSISQTEYDTAKANYETTRAAIGVSEAAIGLAEAQLNEAKVNLGFTIIKSPVKGVVIDRRVNIGQTVVAGLSAPSLFLLAKDLKRVQVWVSVNEADIGNIRIGQDATFTVDTYAGQTFKGKVTKVRLNAIMTQNVVTYTVEVTTDNPITKEHPEGMLLPYLTANVKFIIDEKKDVKLVSNAALRWRPALAHVHPDYRSAYEQSLKRKAVAAESGGKLAGEAGKEQNQQNRGIVWVEQDGFVRPVKVLTGLTDSVNTELVDVVDDKDKAILDVDAPVVVSEVKGGGPAGGTVNPFVTPMFGKKKQ